MLVKAYYDTHKMPVCITRCSNNYGPYQFPEKFIPLIMNNCLKHIGIRMMIRSMSPQIIATDEIGGLEDERAIEEAGYAGVKLLLTAHGETIDDVSKNLLNNKIFKNIIVLGKSRQPGFIKNIYLLKEEKYVVNY